MNVTVKLNKSQYIKDVDYFKVQKRIHSETMNLRKRPKNPGKL